MILTGDCRDILPTLDAGSVHCVVTSPPYWGLRDYGVAGQLGLEPTPEEYVANMVAVFREVRRVLRDDGTVWLNLGDSYATVKDGNTNGSTSSTLGMSKGAGNHAAAVRRLADVAAANGARRSSVPGGLKPKDLVGIPWRVAFALQADGWYLRSDIIWSKPNPMPESVTDRPTKSHEYVFLLSKSARYYFDQEAVREANAPDYAEPRAIIRRSDAKTVGDTVNDGRTMRAYNAAGMDAGRYSGLGRNIRSVWTIATQPYPGAHFAVFPEALVVPCIKAGTSEHGVCPECGAPWERVVERETVPQRVGDWKATGEDHRNDIDRKGGFYPVSVDRGWHPSCAHDAEPVPATVLDPFAGSGTVGKVAEKLSRRAILIELNPDYIEQAERRTAQVGLGLMAS